MIATDYAVEVQYSAENKGYLATVREFPQLYYVAHTPRGAHEGLMMKLGSMLSARRFNDLSIPRPFANARW